MIDQPIEILLVEDNPNDVELTLRGLRTHNIANRVLVVGDGAQALDYLLARGEHEGRYVGPLPKVVQLDLKLPKVDGFEVLQALRADPRTATNPVVVLTSSAEERDIVQGYKIGTNSYVVKPVDFAHFAQAVSDLGLYWLLLDRLPEAGPTR